MRFACFTLGLAVGGMVVVGSVSGQTLPSTMVSVSSDSGTPSALMMSYDALAGADPEAYLPLYSIAGDEDMKLATAEAKFDAQVGMLQKIVELLWGADAVNQTVHALGMQTSDDIHSAKVVVTGDRARVIYADGTAGPLLMKTIAGWRLDTTAFRKSLGAPLIDYVRQLHRMSAIVAGIADGIDQKRLRSVDAVTHEIAVKMAVMGK